MLKKLKVKHIILLILVIYILYLVLMNGTNYIRLNKLMEVSVDIQKNIKEIGVIYSHEIKRYHFSTEKELNQNDSFDYFYKLNGAEDFNSADFIMNYTYQHHFPWHKISDISFSIENEGGIYVFRDKYFLNIPLFTTIEYIFVCKNESDYYLYNILFYVPVNKYEKILYSRIENNNM